MQQADLMLFPAAPALDVARYEAWPFPGLTAHETAQSVLAQSPEFKAAIAAAILTINHPMTTEAMVCAAVSQDWKDTLGPWCHAGLCAREAESHGIAVRPVPHDGGGLHFEYRVVS